MGVLERCRAMIVGQIVGQISFHGTSAARWARGYTISGPNLFRIRCGFPSPTASNGSINSSGLGCFKPRGVCFVAIDSSDWFWRKYKFRTASSPHKRLFSGHLLSRISPILASVTELIDQLLHALPFGFHFFPRTFARNVDLGTKNHPGAKTVWELQIDPRY